MTPILANSGTYCLIMKLDRARQIQVGRLGTGAFPAGYYCYVGSALRGLEQRLNRHFSPEKRMHWHVDYLLAKAKALGAVAVYSGDRLECGLSRLVAKEAACEPMAGFGASDCACRTHLYYFRRSPKTLLRGLCRLIAGGERVIFIAHLSRKGVGRRESGKAPVSALFL